MREFRVVWAIDVDGQNELDAARRAYAMQRDPESIATVFQVCRRCECGALHPDDAVQVDLVEASHVEH